MGQRIFVFMIGGATRSEVGFVKNFSVRFIYLQYCDFRDPLTCFILMRSATSLLQDDNEIEKGSYPWNYQYPRTPTVYYGMYAHTILIISLRNPIKVKHCI